MVFRSLIVVDILMKRFDGGAISSWDFNGADSELGYSGGMARWKRSATTFDDAGN